MHSPVDIYLAPTMFQTSLPPFPRGLWDKGSGQKEAVLSSSPGTGRPGV